MNKFLKSTDPYQNFSVEHWMAFCVFLLLLILLVFLSKKYLNIKQKKTVQVFLSFIPLLTLLLRSVIDATQRSLSLQEDLPLHLCRILSIAAPFVIIYGKERHLKVFYYLVLAGTLNALITADIDFGYPHYGYFLYWIYHGSLVILAFYGVLSFKIRLGIKEGVTAFILINIYMIFIHFVNLLLRSNYMYTSSKPANATILDHLGNWPYYIIWVELLALIMLLLVYLLVGNLLLPARNSKEIKD